LNKNSILTIVIVFKVRFLLAILILPSLQLVVLLLSLLLLVLLMLLRLLMRSSQVSSKFRVYKFVASSEILARNCAPVFLEHHQPTQHG
jgi:hypothetical protein